jgi:5-methylcytosine-specific restriction endonuclease McrA
MSYDLCEYNNSHPGMRCQSQALRLAIKQATNAKPVSQANKPQRSLSRRTLRNSDVASKSKGFFVNMRVAVLDTTRKPLAPTPPRRARLLLKSGKAAVFRRYPFTLILKREVVGVQTPDLRLKVDPGSKTTGVAIVHQDTGEVVFAAEIGHRGQAIKKNLDARRAIRRGRRNRKTRYREPRFDNRRRSEGSLPPSLESRVENAFTWSRRLIRVYPIKGLGLELVKFDMQLMQNPEIEGVEYQQGELEGFELREYVLIKFNHKCAYSGDDSPCDEILNVDHVVPRSGGGSNRVSNLVCACRKHNEEKNNLSLEEYGRLRGKDFDHVKAQAKAPLKDAAAVNATRWALFHRLKGTGLVVETGSGGLTKFNRAQRGLPKAHWIDAACVGRSTPEKVEIANVQPLRIKATGRGTRQMCSTNKYGFPIRHRTRRKTFLGFETGDIVKADIPRGKYVGRYVGRVTIRQRPSFILNGVDTHPKYLKRIHRSDGYEYQGQIKNGSRANAKQRKADGHSTSLP